MPKGHRTSAQDWLPLIESWKSSGLTKKAFCIQRGIAYKSFMKWYSQIMPPKLLRSPLIDSNNYTEEPLFIPVEIQSMETTKVVKSLSPLILILNSSVQLQIPIEAINSQLFTVLFKALGV